MAAGVYNIVAEQGATFSLPITWKTGGVPVDLTGYTARLQIRSTVDDPTVAVELGTDTAGIELGGPAGTIQITIPATQTAGMAPGCYAYDLLLAAGLVDTRLLEGSFTLKAAVTR